MAAGWLAFLALLVPATDDATASALTTVSIAIAAIFGALALASAFWPGARSKAGFWLAVAVLGLIVVLLNAPYIPAALAHPSDTGSFLVTILVVAAGAAVTIGGIAAFLDVRRGRPTWSRTGRMGLVILAIVGALLGAATTSVLAGSASAGTGRIGAVPTVTGVLTAANTTFVQTDLSMTGTDVLGLFVVNDDKIGHQLDIDSLGIHVPLPPDSTTAVAITPTGTGKLEYYCSIPGHRDAGMVGTIAVD
jgi:hypothetical protein